METDRTAATVEWERFDYNHGETIRQRECPDCDRGLLLAPARFCSRCGGSGYLTATADYEVELTALADAFGRVLEYLRAETASITEAEAAEIADAALFRAERVLDRGR